MPKGRRSDFAYQRNAGSTQSFKPLPRRMQEGLDEADAFTKDGNLIAARQTLEALDRQYPNREEILTELVNLNIELHDLPSLITACERFIKVAPHIPDAQITLGGAYMESVYPTLALRQFQQVLKNFPTHERARDLRESVIKLEVFVVQSLHKAGFVGAEGMVFLEKHEQAQVYLAQGNFDQGRRMCEELIRARPTFASAHNNLSLMYYSEGHYEQAIAAAGQVLTFEPNNLHALSNLARFYCLSGDAHQAREAANRLQAVQDPDNSDLPIKKAEAFSFLGDDQAVLDVALAAEEGQTKNEHNLPSNALLWHLGGVAAMRLGDEKTARRMWQRTLAISPGFTLSRDNLDVLSLPMGERHTAWPFTLNYWLRRPVLDALVAETTSAAKQSEHANHEDEDNSRMTKATQRVLHKFPELQTLVPMLLERGDPQGREMALMIAEMSKVPALLAALRDFALSQFGPDAMRMKAGQAAREANLLPPGPTRFWLKGEWQEVRLMGFKISFEPSGFDHSPRVQDLTEQAYAALQDDDAEEAEALLEDALVLEPDSPDLLNNLCKAYELQGRSDAALVLTEDIHRRFPDYLFARVTLAAVRAKEGRTDEAAALLDPLLIREEFHISEYAALVMAQVELALARNQPEAAQSLVDMLADVAPDYPTTAQLRARLTPPKVSANKLLRKAFGGLWKK